MSTNPNLDVFGYFVANGERINVRGSNYTIINGHHRVRAMNQNPCAEIALTTEINDEYIKELLKNKEIDTEEYRKHVEEYMRTPINLERVIYELTFGITSKNHPKAEQYLRGNQIIEITLTLYRDLCPTLQEELLNVKRPKVSWDDLFISEVDRMNRNYPGLFNDLHAKYAEGKTEAESWIIRHVLNVWYQHGTWRTFKNLLGAGGGKKLMAAHYIYDAGIRAAWEDEWKTQNVLEIRENIYQNRAFDQMPILADALEDAGCDNMQMIQHLRNGKFFSRASCVFQR